MRPQAIIWFERLNLGTLALGVVQSWLAWDTLVKTGQSIAFILAVQIFSFGLVIALTLLVSRRRSKVAMWILVVFFVLGLPGMFMMLRGGLLLGSHVISIMQTLAQFSALVLLFTGPARRWMNREKSDTDLGDVFA
jgi:hypothetical protein